MVRIVLRARSLTRAQVLVSAVALVSAAIGLSARSSTLATVYVAVADAQGRPVGGLGVSDFVLSASETSTRVLAVRPATDPVSLAVVLATERGETLLVEESLGAITDELRQIPGSRVGLARWEDGTVSLDSVSLSVDPLVTAFRREFPNPVDVAPGVVGSLHALGWERTPRRAVLVIRRTGFENQAFPLSYVTDAAFTQSVSGSGASLWVIAVQTEFAGDPRVDRLLGQDAARSGGRAESLVKSTGIPAMTREFMALLASQYAVTYETPSRLASDDNALQVGVRRAGVRVMAPAWSR
jgi:hypothetical protein